MPADFDASTFTVLIIKFKVYFYASRPIAKIILVQTHSIANLTNGAVQDCMGSRWLEFLPPTSEAAGSNLGPGASCWKVVSYLPMPSGLQCSMHWFPPPVNYLSQYDPGY